MIKSMHIENFKCFKDFDIELGPFNVLVGPNDSGKTALLEAIDAVSKLRNNRGELDVSKMASLVGWDDNSPVFWRGLGNQVVKIRVMAPDWKWEEGQQYLEIRLEGSGWTLRFVEEAQHSSERSGGDFLTQKQFDKDIGNIVFYKLNPSALKESCKHSDNPFVLQKDGSGLAGMLLSIAGDNPIQYEQLRKEFQNRFGYLVKARSAKGSRVKIVFESHSVELGSRAVSDGVILSLAFMTLVHVPKPPRILLIEEPENGVHHASLKEIVDTLRNLSKDKGVQIILTTHSPYLLDLVEPEEVRVFSKDEEGAVHAAKLSEYPDVDDLKKHFMTGEIWTEFDEKDIVAGRETVK